MQKIVEELRQKRIEERRIQKLEQKKKREEQQRIREELYRKSVEGKEILTGLYLGNAKVGSCILYSIFFLVNFFFFFNNTMYVILSFTFFSCVSFFLSPLFPPYSFVINTRKGGRE